MPHFQDAFAALSLHGSANDGANSLSSRLKSLREKGKILQPRRQHNMRGNDLEVIVISDDEVEAVLGNGRRRRRSPSPRSTSASSIGSSSDGQGSDFDAFRDIPQPQANRLDRSVSTKRHKSDHRESDGTHIGQSANGHAQDVLHRARLSAQNYPKAKVATPVDSDGRAKLNSTQRHSTGDHLADAQIDSDRTSRSKGKTSIRRPKEICPYYYDEKLDVRMYRGPGYEQFSVVLGDDEEHQMVCESWDAHQIVKHEGQPYGLSPTSPGMSTRSAYDLTDVAADADNRTIAEFWCLKEVLNVFPQVNYDFVIEKFRTRCAQLAQSASDDVAEQVRPAEIIAEIAELETIPKQEEAAKKVKIAKWSKDETGITIAFDKSSREGPNYHKEGVILLATQFGHVPTHYISRRLHEVKSIFDTYIHLFESEEHYYDSAYRPYNRNRTPRVTLEKKYARSTYAARPEPVQYANLINEMQAAKQHLARKAQQENQQKQKEMDEATNLELHRLQGALVTCQCCFDEEIAINRAVTCDGDNIHFFCYACVENLAKSQVGSMKHLMLCMDGSGCQASLTIDSVGRAIHIKLLDKLAFYQQQNEVAAAGIEGLAQCPFCEFKAICEPVEVDSVFSCQNPDCARSSCRKCNRASHLPRTCEEVQKDHGLSARHRVEEARSEAMMRSCPKCSVKIIKELGCNKMRCSCGTIMCYVCKKDISSGKENGYEHFHRSGSKCPLYDDKGSERHDADADAAEAAAIKEVKQKAGNEDIDEKTLRIEKAAKQAKKANTAPAVRAQRRLQLDGEDGEDDDDDDDDDEPFPFRPDALNMHLRAIQAQADQVRHIELRRQDLILRGPHLDIQNRPLQAQFDRVQRAAQTMGVQFNIYGAPGLEAQNNYNHAVPQYNLFGEEQRKEVVDHNPWLLPQRQQPIQKPGMIRATPANRGRRVAFDLPPDFDMNMDFEDILDVPVDAAALDGNRNLDARAANANANANPAARVQNWVRVQRDRDLPHPRRAGRGAR